MSDLWYRAFKRCHWIGWYATYHFSFDPDHLDSQESIGLCLESIRPIVRIRVAFMLVYKVKLSTMHFMCLKVWSQRNGGRCLEFSRAGDMKTKPALSFGRLALTHDEAISKSESDWTICRSRKVVLKQRETYSVS